MSQKIMPCLWFNMNAEEAIKLYATVFPDFEELDEMRYGEGGPHPAGTLLTKTFKIQGQEFMALNGGPEFSFTEAVSFVIDCESQEEVDHYWDKLTEGGEESQCGWLKDPFGVSWQVVPRRLMELLQSDDAATAQRVTQAMFQMSKIEIAKLEEAAAAS